MARLSPQVLVQLARRTVQQEHKWKHTAEHAPPIPDGADSDDPTAALAPLDVRWLEQLGFPATYRRGYGLPWAVGARLHVEAAATAESHPRGEQSSHRSGHN